MNRKNSTPASYRIRVQGELENSWSERLGGMKVTVERFEYKKPVTVLNGPLRDQAALAGVLNTLYDARIAVLSVERLDG
jgi:hypothetical protein